MIVVMRKSNVLLFTLLFFLVIALYSLNSANTLATTTANIKEGQKCVILDAGHGGEDPGAVSDFNGIKEKEVNLKIALMTKDLLEAEGINVILTRSEDKLDYTTTKKDILQKRKEDLTRRKKIMDENNAQLVVSIHLNKFPQEKYFGAQVFYPPKSPESQKLAEGLQDSLRRLVDEKNTRVALLKDTQPPIMILKDLKTPTAIVECGFLSNINEEKLLGTKEYQEKLAAAIKDGISAYFK